MLPTASPKSARPGSACQAIMLGSVAACSSGGSRSQALIIKDALSACVGFSSCASYLPIGAWKAHVFPCSADLPPLW